MERYIRLGCRHFNLPLPYSLRVYTPRKIKHQDTLATITTDGNNKYHIVIQILRLINKKKIYKLTKPNLLKSLAHELAHIPYWNHSKEWQVLENNIERYFKILYLMENLQTKVD